MTKHDDFGSGPDWADRDRSRLRPSLIEIVTGLALAAGILLLAIYDAKAGEVLSVSRLPGGGFSVNSFTVDASPRVIQVPRDLSEVADARITRWTAYCQPTPVTDSLGVERLHYAKPGCEFGRDHD